MDGWTYAQLWETVAACIPSAPALVHGETRRTWAEFDQRADGLAQFLLDSGCQHQDKVAFYLHNRPEYLETFAACSKASLVHVNTNYRYAPHEIVYLWQNADAVAVVFQGAFIDLIEEVRPRLPLVTVWIWVDDGEGACPDWAVPYEAAAGTSTDGRVQGPWGRSGDDLLLLYTGGTTGMPKGVMWRQSDLIPAMDSGNRERLPIAPDCGVGEFSPAVRKRTLGPGPIGLPACPLMHGTGLFNSLNTLSLGGSLVMLNQRRFDVIELLDTMERERVKSLYIVGDAFAKPILRALDEDPAKWDISSLRVIISSGVMWSVESKEGLVSHNPNLIMVDSFGSSEAFGLGSDISSASHAPRTARFKLGPRSVVIGEDGALIVPGSGKLAELGSPVTPPLDTTKTLRSRRRSSRPSMVFVTRFPATSPR
jgi:3-oxocholest-4-en-26-oate---CoA ligase